MIVSCIWALFFLTHIGKPLGRDCCKPLRGLQAIWDFNTLLWVGRGGVYIVIDLTIYMCVINSFHWILMVIEIPKNRLIVYDSLRKSQENYKQMVNVIQRYVMSISTRRISRYDSAILSWRSTMAMCRVWERFVDVNISLVVKYRLIWFIHK